MASIEEDLRFINPRVKIKKFIGGVYSHTTATVTYQEDGELKKIEFRLYPGSHLNADERTALEQRNEGLLSNMQIDSSDYSQEIGNGLAFVKQALFNTTKLLSKEEEMTDLGECLIERTVIEISEDKISALQKLHDDLEGGEYRYSVFDGQNKVHCGTVVQKVLNIVTSGTEDAALSKLSLLEEYSTTNPSKVFERAKSVMAAQHARKFSLTLSYKTLFAAIVKTGHPASIFATKVPSIDRFSPALLLWPNVYALLTKPNDAMNQQEPVINSTRTNAVFSSFLQKINRPDQSVVNHGKNQFSFNSAFLAYNRPVTASIFAVNFFKAFPIIANPEVSQKTSTFCPK